MKKVLIIWWWPWWLCSGMILSSKWYDVQIFEKEPRVWWRNNHVELWSYKFDLWPTFLMYLKSLEDIFEMSWKNISDYLELTRLDPLYKLSFEDKSFVPRAKIEDTYEEIKKVFPWEEEAYLKYIEKEWKKFEYLMPCLEVPYSKFSAFFKKRFLRALPKLDLFKSLYSRLSYYFKNEDLKISMAFQSKYIWMSPWNCPAWFTILSYFEHKFWLYHVKWWLNQISKAMWKIISESWWRINLETSVKKIIVENNKAKWVILENWESVYWDYVIINADFSYAMTNLIENKDRKKYRDEKISKKEYSCSTFMIYLWLDKIYENINHHNVIFNKDYKKFVENIVDFKDISDDFSFYLHNPSLIDDTLAPKWHSVLYILVPTPNNTKEFDWESKKQKIEKYIFDKIKQRFWIDDLEEHIKEKLIITPKDWEEKYNIYKGAVFNLSHKVTQMLYFRPHNEFEDIENVYLAGWWTHPWSWLPTIYESAKISCDMILKK